MDNRRTRRSGFTAVLVTALLVAPPALGGETPDPQTEEGWRIRFYAASIDFDSTGGYQRGSRPAHDLDIGFGFGINGEYRFSRRLGIDLGVLGGAAVDVAFNEAATGEWVWTEYETLTFTPISAGLDIHLTPDKDVDLYVRPMLAWIRYGGLEFHSSGGWSRTTVEFEEDIGVGISLGLDVPFGRPERWFFTATLSHLESELRGRDRSSGSMFGDYDATILGFGFGYRFRGDAK
jgi:hypothetical protein